jgi:hypothetical protein
MVDAVPTEGITVPVIVDLQAKLMKDLLRDSRDFGGIRRRLVNIDGSVHAPSNIPSLLEETLHPSSTRSDRCATRSRPPFSSGSTWPACNPRRTATSAPVGWAPTCR